MLLSLLGPRLITARLVFDSRFDQILEFSHEEDLPTRSPSSVDGEPGPLQIVCDAVEIFRSLAQTSTIAAKGVTVISALIEEQLRKRSGRLGGGLTGGLKRKATPEGGYGRTEVELERAIKVRVALVWSCRAISRLLETDLIRVSRPGPASSTQQRHHPDRCAFLPFQRRRLVHLLVGL